MLLMRRMVGPVALSLHELSVFVSILGTHMLSDVGITFGKQRFEILVFFVFDQESVVDLFGAKSNGGVPGRFGHVVGSQTAGEHRLVL